MVELGDYDIVDGKALAITLLHEKRTKNASGKMRRQHEMVGEVLKSHEGLNEFAKTHEWLVGF